VGWGGGVKWVNLDEFSEQRFRSCKSDGSKKKLLSSFANISFREGRFCVVIIRSSKPKFRNEHSSNHDRIWCPVLVSVSKSCRSCDLSHCLRQVYVIYFG
jgi:hypothetical protein